MISHNYENERFHKQITSLKMNEKDVQRSATVIAIINISTTKKKTEED